MVTLKQIRNFSVLAETLHFAHAAQKLDIAPAVLSKEIMKMEKSLGFKLFDRSEKRNIKLTDGGKVYLAGTRDLLKKLEQAAAAGKRTEAGELGSLTAAISGVSARFFNLENLCRKITIDYPDVNFCLREIFTPGQTKELLEKDLCDVAVFPYVADHSPELPENIETRNCGSYALNYAIPAQHPLAHQAEIRPKDVFRHPLILPSRDFAPGLRKFLDHTFLSDTGKIPEPSFEVDGLNICWSLIAAGIGIGFIAGNHRPEGKMRDKIILRPMPESIRIQNIIAWKSGQTSPFLKNFISVFLKSAHPGEKNT